MAFHFRGDDMNKVSLSRQDRLIINRNQKELQALKVQAINLSETMRDIRNQSREILGREYSNEIK